MNIILNVFDTVLNLLVNLSYRVLEMVPAVLAAVVVLLLGSYLARALRYLVEYVLGYIKLDHLCERVEISHLCHRLGMGRSLTKVVGIAAYWSVFLMFLMSAADLVHLAVVSEYLHRVMGFLPRLLAVMLVLGGGFVLAHFFSHVVQSAAHANHISEADILGRVSYWIMVLFSTMVALQRLGIDTEMFMDYPHILVGALGLGFAIAFGLSYGMGRFGAFMKAPRGKVHLNVVKAKSA